MTNVEIFIKSLKITWIRTFYLSKLDRYFFWEFLDVIYVPINYVILDRNAVDLWQMPLVITFGKNLYIFMWFSENIETDDINIMIQSLWIHNKVKIQNKYVFCKDLYEKGFHIAHVYLLLKVNSLVMR